jgi:hypothetical protein
MNGPARMVLGVALAIALAGALLVLLNMEKRPKFPIDNRKQF